MECQWWNIKEQTWKSSELQNCAISNSQNGLACGGKAYVRGSVSSRDLGSPLKRTYSPTGALCRSEVRHSNSTHLCPLICADVSARPWLQAGYPEPPFCQTGSFFFFLFVIIIFSSFPPSHLGGPRISPEIPRIPRTTCSNPSRVDSVLRPSRVNWLRCTLLRGGNFWMRF